MSWTLIAGGSSGIGAEIAYTYAKLGANLVVTGRNQQKLRDFCNNLSSSFPNIKIDSICCDHSIDKENVILVDSLRKKNITLNAAVSCIGVSNLGGEEPYTLTKPSIFENYLSNNLTANYSLIYTIRPFLCENAAICILGSIAGSERIGAPCGYSIAKAALTALVTHMSAILSPTNRINMVSPGNVFTKEGVWDRKIKSDPKRTHDYIASNVPMKRLAAASEIAEAVLFLNSDKSTFTTGANLTVDGGQLNRYPQ
ncbi:SDR family NAD(P)-dependent oxidoreductase [Synechococcus sp. N19]|uniref:SDR family NAD(P)-dependent oxidoreductase n=1 Tax=Synechococcus sp. N19 TaxID=2575512 RepID=UPI000E0E9480|nr:SDR family oxidoreductase [Synechococcus sp. N19]